MRHLFGLLVCASFLSPISLHAEEAPDASPDASAADSSIIVTARRRAEDAQQVPVAMTVVGADTLQRSYTVNLNQVSQLVPALRSEEHTSELQSH